MSTDYRLTAVNLAARFAAGVVTPPAGFTNIRISTANPPNKLGGVFPQVVVFADSGTYEYSTNDRIGTEHFMVRFYYAAIGDVARDMVALESWLTVLVDQTYGAIQFGGQATILSVKVVSWTIGPLEYAGQQYSGIELGVDITTNQRATVVS